MMRCLLLFLVVALGVIPAHAQGIVGDVLSGKLVNPKVGQWAWYELVDSRTNESYLIRQAVVGKEKVDRRTGHWVEVEVAPKVGYGTVYKMLLTGPASDAKNVHRILVKQGEDMAREIPVRQTGDELSQPRAERKSLGQDRVKTKAGDIDTEHFSMSQDGQTTEVWLSDDVPPTGIVRMVSPDGELVLREFGVGGEEGKTRIEPKDIMPEPTGKTKVKVDVVDKPDEDRD